MALALNNLKRVDMPLNKETKPNLTVFEYKIPHNLMSIFILNLIHFFKVHFNLLWLDLIWNC